jgi:hypothetical protein
MEIKKLILGFINVIIILISSCETKTKLSEKTKLSPKFISQLDSIKKNIKEGQIIFRGGTDIESAIIRDFSYEDKLFSHCAIILKQENKLVVTHILGGSTNPEGNILSQSVEDFFIYPDNESAGIYDINLNNKELERIYQYVDAIKKEKITFDLKFNLLDKSKLYCSEFIINALQFAKNTEKIFPHTTFNLKNTKYFSIANKGDSFLFYPIDIFQHNKLLKEKFIFYFPNFRKS